MLSKLFKILPIACGFISLSGINRLSLLKKIVLFDNGKSFKKKFKTTVIKNVIWARAFIIAELNDLPEKQALKDRLLENQNKFGKMLSAAFGKDTSDEITQLLREHKRITLELLHEIKINNQKPIKSIETQWYNNINDIAVFLNKINPQWSVSYLNKKIGGLLKLTKEEMVLRANKNWKKDIENFDKIIDYAINLADEIADGIIKYLSSN